MNIYLVGFMGSGKTTVGQLLAKRLALPFFDLDQMIEESRELTIAQIFAESGEEYFRKLETGVLLESENWRPHVMALGGGAYESQRNRNFLHQNGLVIWLQVSFQEACDRCSMDSSRPLAQNPEQFKDLFTSRQTNYSKADLQVAGNNKEPEELTEEILRRLRSHWPTYK